jgi:hypothetical protein
MIVDVQHTTLICDASQCDSAPDASRRRRDHRACMHEGSYMQCSY